MSLSRSGPRKFARPQEDAGASLAARPTGDGSAGPARGKRARAWMEPDEPVAASPGAGGVTEARGGADRAGGRVGEAGADVQRTPQGPSARLREMRAAQDDKRQRGKPRADAAREALVAVLECREVRLPSGRVVVGPPVDRRRGQQPTRRWSDAAGLYVRRHHHAYCVQFAQRLDARHIELCDLVQACEVGCWEALCRYELGHETAWRFLSYAKHWMLCVCNRLIHKEEPLVFVPEELKRLRGTIDRLVSAGFVADDAEDEDVVAALVSWGEAELGGERPAAGARGAAEASGPRVAAARGVSLSHDHRGIDERAGVLRRALDERQDEADSSALDAERHESLQAGLSRLPDELRVALLEAAQRDDWAACAGQRERSLLSIAERRLREEVQRG